MPESIEVTVGAPVEVEVNTQTIEVEVSTTGSPEVEVSNGASTVNLIVGPVDPEQVELHGAGLIFQTGLGPNGEDWTLWIEDGQ